MYDRPTIYDVAFGFRDIGAEVDVLLGWYARAGRAPAAAGKPAAAVEMAAGPADHAIELARRGVAATAVDLSPAMCGHARWKAARAAVALAVVNADMIDFRLERRVDLALTMISSISHVYTVDDLVRHLATVAVNVNEGGVYVIEMPHPADILGGGGRKPAGTEWTETRDGIVVETRWGGAGDDFDPITQIQDANVEMRVRSEHGDGSVEVHRDRVRMKHWTATEFEAVVKLSGHFEIAERHGHFALDGPFDSGPESWRMIAVLRKRG